MKSQVEFAQIKSLQTTKTHGGSLRHPQKHKRPLTFRSRNHFVLKSSRAKGDWSFRRHRFEIAGILKKFARKHSVGLVGYANVGNHIHLNLELSSRRQYQKFIRAVCAAIMMQVTGFSRWRRAPEGFRFWDARPFSRLVQSWREVLALDKYFDVNRMEGAGYTRSQAREWAHLLWAYRGP